MNWYSVALFGHIVGALLLFAVLTVEGLSYRIGFDAAPMNRIAGPIAGVLILIPGFYMMEAQWGWAAWVVVGIATYVLIAAAGAYTGITLMRGSMERRAAFVSWLVRVGMALAVVFDMAVKPDLLASMIAVAAGVALGFGSGLVVSRGARTA